MESIAIVGGLLVVGLFFTVAYIAERETVLQWFVIAVLAMMDLGFIAVGAPLSLVAVTGNALTPAGDAARPLDPAGSAMPLPGVTPQTVQSINEVLGSAEAIRSLALLGLVLVVLGIVGLLLLVPPVRRLVARLIPIDPQRLVHTLGMHMALVVLALSALVAATLPMLAAGEESLGELARATEQSGLAALWAQALGFAILSVLGVGLFVRRGSDEVLGRLGLSRAFSVRWWLAATILGVASSFALDLVWSTLDPASFESVSRLSEAMFAPYLKHGVWAALTIGLSAGLGEEMLFRGAAQPRLGLLTTALLFMAIHTQYTISLALFQMLFMGLLLGIVRARANTTTSIGVHATYNFILVMFAIYAPDLSP